MYRTNATLEAICKRVADEFEAKYGFSLNPELIFEIYGSQSEGVLHFMRLQEPVKMRGLVAFVPKADKLAKHNIQPINKTITTTRVHNRKRIVVTYDPLPADFQQLIVI